MTQANARSDSVHASCVAIDSDRGVLIMGASGSGKSGLALMMMSLGASLVADDRTKLTSSPDGTALIASAPQSIQNLIEARGIGILKAQTLPSCTICAVIDLDHCEEERLPPRRIRRLIGHDIPEYRRSDEPHFAAALIQLLKGGRCA